MPGLDAKREDGVEERESVTHEPIQYFPRPRVMSKQAALLKNSTPQQQIDASRYFSHQEGAPQSYNAETPQGKYFLTLHLLCDLSDFQLERVGNVSGVNLGRRIENAKGLAQRFWGRVARPMAGIECVGIIRQVLREHMLKYPVIFEHRGSAVDFTPLPSISLLHDELMSSLFRTIPLGGGFSLNTDTSESLTWAVLDTINCQYCDSKYDENLREYSSRYEGKNKVVLMT